MAAEDIKVTVRVVNPLEVRVRRKFDWQNLEVLASVRRRTEDGEPILLVGCRWNREWVPLKFLDRKARHWWDRLCYVPPRWLPCPEAQTQLQTCGSIATKMADYDANLSADPTRRRVRVAESPSRTSRTASQMSLKKCSESGDRLNMLPGRKKTHKKEIYRRYAELYKKMTAADVDRPRRELKRSLRRLDREAEELKKSPSPEIIDERILSLIHCLLDMNADEFICNLFAERDGFLGPQKMLAGAEIKELSPKAELESVLSLLDTAENGEGSAIVEEIVAETESKVVDGEGQAQEPDQVKEGDLSKSEEVEEGVLANYLTAEKKNLQPLDEFKDMEEKENEEDKTEEKNSVDEQNEKLEVSTLVPDSPVYNAESAVEYFADDAPEAVFERNEEAAADLAGEEQASENTANEADNAVVQSFDADEKPQNSPLTDQDNIFDNAIDSETKEVSIVQDRDENSTKEDSEAIEAPILVLDTEIPEAVVPEKESTAEENTANGHETTVESAIETTEASKEEPKLDVEDSFSAESSEPPEIIIDINYLLEEEPVPIEVQQQIKAKPNHLDVIGSPVRFPPVRKNWLVRSTDDPWWERLSKPRTLPQLRSPPKLKQFKAMPYKDATTPRATSSGSEKSLNWADRLAVPRVRRRKTETQTYPRPFKMLKHSRVILQNKRYSKDWWDRLSVPKKIEHKKPASNKSNASGVSKKQEGETEVEQINSVPNE